MKRFIIAVLCVLAILGVGLTIYLCVSSTATFKESEEMKKVRTMQAVEADVATEKIQLDYESVCEMINRQIDTEEKLILLTESGLCTTSHDRTPKNSWWSDWLVNSSIELKMNYRAIISIPTDSIYCKITGNDIKIFYDYDAIKVEAVEFSSIIPITTRSMCGKQYTPSEVAALILLSRDEIVEMVNNNEEVLKQAENNLKDSISTKIQDLTGHTISVERIELDTILE